MKIYNQEKTEIIENPNLEKGHLEESTITHHFDAVEGVEEKGHYEVVRVYPNGGQDVEWVVDVAGVEEVEEHDETEDIYVYIPYTEQELAKINAQKRIEELKSLLSSSDYKAIKYAEGELTEEEYAETKALRRGYRAEINQLQEMYNI